jgi:hypothetical protein
MKVNITKVRAHIAIHFDLRGSILAQTIQAGCQKVVTSYDIESPDDQARVAAVLRNARNGCWVRAAVTNPVPFDDSIILNGHAFHIDAFPPHRAE